MTRGGRPFEPGGCAPSTREPARSAGERLDADRERCLDVLVPETRAALATGQVLDLVIDEL